MKNAKQLLVQLNPESEHFIPDAADVVSPAVLAQVFGGGPLPFPTNADGSVATSVYMEHLEATWALAMEDVAEDQPCGAERFESILWARPPKDAVDFVAFPIGPLSENERAGV